MAKSSDQMKNMVEDYLKTAGIKYIDSTKKMQEKNPNIEWQLVARQTHFTKSKNRDDRITIHNPIIFRKLADVFNQLPNSQKIPLINKINEVVIMKGQIFNWIPIKPKEIEGNINPSKNDKENKGKAPELEGISISTYIDEQELSRPNLYSKIDSLSGTVTLVSSLLIQNIRPDMFQEASTSNEPKGDFFQ